MKNFISLFLSLIFGFVAFGCQKKKAETNAVSDPIEVNAELLKKSPSFENYINYGLALNKAQRFSEALSAYKSASQINPSAPLAWNNLCSVKIEMGLFADAIDDCNKALSLEPNYELAKNNLTQAQAQLANLKKDLKEKKSNLIASAKTSEDYLSLGLQFFNARELNDAIKIWNQISNQNDVFYAKAQNNIGSAYILMKKYDAAEKALNTALSKEPNNELFNNNKKWLEDEKKSASK